MAVNFSITLLHGVSSHTVRTSIAVPNFYINSSPTANFTYPRYSIVSSFANRFHICWWQFSCSQISIPMRLFVPLFIFYICRVYNFVGTYGLVGF